MKDRINKQPDIEKQKVVLLTLKTFSLTGGVEKVGKIISLVISSLNAARYTSKIISLYDPADCVDRQYVKGGAFDGLGGKLPAFLYNAVTAGIGSQTVILNHINLAAVGVVIKLLSPNVKLVTITHGIEVWRPLSFMQKRVLKLADSVVSVSRFTRDKLIELHQVDPEKIVVLNNCIDPYMNIPAEFTKPGYLIERFGFTKAQYVLFTMTRLSFSEQKKGYDEIIRAVSELKEKYPQLVYLLGGKCDVAEQERLTLLINDYGVNNHVKLCGFIKDEELTDFFLLTDTYIMPSKKEGFGIVFIEALACGLHTIAGNKDGSVDALADGELGTLIDPDSYKEILNAIQDAVKGDDARVRKTIQHKALSRFNYAGYTNKLKSILGTAD